MRQENGRLPREPAILVVPPTVRIVMAVLNAMIAGMPMIALMFLLGALPGNPEEESAVFGLLLGAACLGAGAAAVSYVLAGHLVFPPDRMACAAMSLLGIGMAHVSWTAWAIFAMPLITLFVPVILFGAILLAPVFAVALGVSAMAVRDAAVREGHGQRRSDSPFLTRRALGVLAWLLASPLVARFGSRFFTANEETGLLVGYAMCLALGLAIDAWPLAQPRSCR
jgi:hypothetical protein